MKQTKILWVQEDYNGPVSGLAEYNNEQVWFSRMGIPTIIANTGVTTCSDTEEKFYLLHRLTPDDLQLVKKEHERYCNEMNLPFNYGDPVVVKRQTIATKNSNLNQTDMSSSVSYRPLANIKRFDYKIPIHSIHDELIGIIKESDFINHNIPHQCTVNFDIK